jgi:hypothetical protein
MPRAYHIAQNLLKFERTMSFMIAKGGSTAQNPRRHAAGKPFHAFLTGWLGQGLASLRFRERMI